MKLQNLLGYEPPDFVAHQPTFPFPSKGGFSIIRQVEERPVISHFARENEPTRQPIAKVKPTYLKNEVAKPSWLRTPGFCSSPLNDFW